MKYDFFRAGSGTRISLDHISRDGALVETLFSISEAIYKSPWLRIMFQIFDLLVLRFTYVYRYGDSPKSHNLN